MNPLSTWTYYQRHKRHAIRQRFREGTGSGGHCGRDECSRKIHRKFTQTLPYEFQVCCTMVTAWTLSG